MTQRYTNNYRILGIRPGATWRELRQAYKKLINIWHPDRFQQDARQRRLAEERTKEINQSYKELSEHYKKFGVLPRIAETTEKSRTENASPHDTSDAPPVPESQGIPPSSTVVTPTPERKSGRSKFSNRALAAAALTGAVYFVWQILPWERTDHLPQNENRGEQAADAQKYYEAPKHRAPAVEKYFTTGTSLGEVYAIQGVPTRTEQNIWYYGDSKVYFGKGRVLRWEENPGNPLRVKHNPETEKMNAMFFGEGASKEEVLAVQGAPDRDAGDVWDYGASRVYFVKNRVRGWDESPFYPLRVHR